jgi:hypothetical protein
MNAIQTRRRGMMLQWRDRFGRLAVAWAICMCATAVGASDLRFDYTVRTPFRAMIEDRSTVEPIDPARCGAEFGWIETVSSRFDSEALERRLPWKKPVRVRKGSDVEIVQAIPKTYGPETGHVVRQMPATMMVEYTGCVVPSGLVLLSFEANISVDADHAPRRLEVTYEGPPMPLKRRWSEADLTRFKVETDLGDATLTGMELSSWPSFSASQRGYFHVSLRLQDLGAIE